MATREEIMQILMEDPAQLERWSRAAGARQQERGDRAINILRGIGGQAPLRRPETGLAAFERERLLQGYVKMLSDAAEGKRAAVGDILDDSQSVRDRLAELDKGNQDILKQLIISSTAIANQNTQSAQAILNKRMDIFEGGAKRITELSQYETGANLESKQWEVINGVGAATRQALGGAASGSTSPNATWPDILKSIHDGMSGLQQQERNSYLIQVNSQIVEASGGQLSLADVVAGAPNQPGIATEVARAFEQVPAGERTISDVRNLNEQVVTQTASALGQGAGASITGTFKQALATYREIVGSDHAMFAKLATPEGRAAAGISTPEQAYELVEQHLGEAYGKQTAQVEMEISRLKTPEGAKTFLEAQPDLFRNQVEGASGGRRGMRQTLRAARSLSRTDNTAAAAFAEGKANRDAGRELAGTPAVIPVGYGLATPPGTAGRKAPLDPLKEEGDMDETADRLKQVSNFQQRDAEMKREALLARLGKGSKPQDPLQPLPMIGANIV